MTLSAAQREAIAEAIRDTYLPSELASALISPVGLGDAAVVELTTRLADAVAGLVVGWVDEARAEGAREAMDAHEDELRDTAGKYVEHLRDARWTPGCRCDHCKNLRPFVQKLVDEARRDERLRIKAGVDDCRILDKGQQIRNVIVDEDLVALADVLVVIEGSEAT